VIIMAKRVKQPVQTDPVARSTLLPIAWWVHYRAEDKGDSPGAALAMGWQSNAGALHGIQVNSRLFASREERAAAGSDPASAEQDAYTAAARYFLDVSRTYLVIRSPADPALTAACTFSVSALSSAERRLPSPSLESRGEYVAQ